MNSEPFQGKQNRAQKIRRAGYMAGGVLLVLICAAALYNLVRRSATRFTRDFSSPFLTVNSYIDDLRTDAKLMSVSKYKLIQALAKMEKNNLELAASAADREILAEENRQLRVLLKIRRRQDFKTVMVRVIARSGDNWNAQFMIDAGKDDGIVPGNLVAASAPDGHIAVAGRVLNVTKHTAVVVTCYSGDFKLSVSAGKNQECGVLEYESGAGIPVLRFLPVRSSVHAGDLVMTSGIPQHTPGGIPLGRLVPLSDGHPFRVRDNLFSEAVVRPLLQPDSIRFAVVYIQETKGR